MQALLCPQLTHRPSNPSPPRRASRRSFAALLLLASLASCSVERAPDVCCTGDGECAQLGLPPGSAREHGCSRGQVCRDLSCVPEVGLDPTVDLPEPGEGSEAYPPKKCGNGVVDPGEVCDDGNRACGTCSADCQILASARASGTISVVSASKLSAGETLTLSDGVHPPRTFEFTRSGSVAQGHTPIFLGLFDNSVAVRDAVVSAINASGLLLVASPATGPFLTVTHTRFTSAGNIPITDTVFTSELTTTGMSGGAGGDCFYGQSCRSDSDCLSNDCSLGICR